MTDLVTIVGGGHAAGELSTALRQGGYTGAVRLIGEEIYLPYQRPPLSKAFLAGEIDAEGLLLKSRATYEKAQVETVLGRRVDKLDRASKTLRFADGSSEAYDKLVLATGGRPRRLAAVGIERAEQCSNFHYLRTIDDVRRIHSQFRAGMKLVIVGGGYVGLEVAAVARKCSIEVTVLEAQERVLARVTAPEVSAFYERVHGEAGVVLKTSTVVKEIHLDESSDAVAALECVGGEVIRADVVIVGVGWKKTTALSSMRTARHPTIRFWQLEIAQGIRACTPVDHSGWSRCRTQSSKRELQHWRSLGSISPMKPCRGFGRSSTTCASKWLGFLKVTTRWCCAAPHRHDLLRPFT
jgi:3-phenylpropionate/trans-cinnamate dioxygenase ferredoxin reductase component